MPGFDFILKGNLGFRPHIFVYVMFCRQFKVTAGTSNDKTFILFSIYTLFQEGSTFSCQAILPCSPLYKLDT